MKTEEITVAICQSPGSEDLPFPRYMTDHAAGMDLYAAVQRDVVIAPGQRILIPAGFALQLPPGFEAQIRPRSGLALKYGITLVNTPGTIDADYRGEVAMIVINHGAAPFIVRRGERLAQMVINRVCRVNWEPKAKLGATARGDGGFGHT